MTARAAIAASFLLSTLAARTQPPVEVEVVVRDKKGPITGLTREDFTVLDQGKPQSIADFTGAAVAEPSRTARPSRRRHPSLRQADAAASGIYFAP
jgi:hypothetical protein